MGWRRVAQEELPLLEPSTRRHLQSYADGVNAYLDRAFRARRSRSSTGCSAWSARARCRRSGHRSTRWRGSRRWPGTCAATCRPRRNARGCPAVLDETQLAQLYPPYPYDRHRPIVGPATCVDESWVPAGGGDARQHAGAARRLGGWRIFLVVPRRRSWPRPSGWRCSTTCSARPGAGSARTPGSSVANGRPAGCRCWPMIHISRPTLAVDLVPDESPVPRGDAGLPVRRRRLHVLGLPRRDHRPHEPDRVGVHQPRAGRQ